MPSRETEEFKLTSDEVEGPLHSRLSEKFKKDPLLFASMAAFSTIAGIGAYRWKTRKTKDPALFLIQLRVAAQGTAVGILAVGMIYKMYEDFIRPRFSNTAQDKD